MHFFKSKTSGLLSYLLIFTLIVTMFSCAGTLSADVSHAAGSVSVSDADSLRAAVDGAAAGDNTVTVSLSNDIILENTSEEPDDTACGLDINGNRTVTILFNGHKITSDTLGTTVNVESGSAVIFGDPGDISNRSETGTAFSAGTPAASLKAASGMELCFYKDTEAKVKTTASDRDAKLVRSVKKAVTPVTYKLKLTASEGGKIKDTNGNIIAGAGKTKTVKCNEGATVTYKAVPVAGYKITAIKVNGKDRTVNKKLGQKITIRNISKDTTLEVTFKIRKFHIEAIKKTTPKGDGGTITKSCYVEYGGKKTFKIAAKFGYEVKKVYIDGESVKIKPKYTFENVKKKHTIKVIFKKAKVLKIMLDAGHVGHYNRYVGKFDGGYYYESLMTWQLHKYLKKYLEKYNNIRVDTTRKSLWRDLGVYERGYKAKGYDLFLSLHSNSSESSKTDYPLVIRQLSANTSEKNLAMKLSKNIGDTMGCKQDFSVWTRYYREGGKKVDYYGVLRGAHAAGCNGYILEHSFHTNRKMALWLYKKSNLRKMARREAAIIAKHYGMKKKDGTVSGEDTGESTAATDETPYRAEITADSVSVHKKPGSSNKQIGTIKKGGVYTIVRLNSTGKWGKLSCDNSGWIRLKGNMKKVKASADVTDYRVRKTVSESLNIRKGPGTNYRIVGKIKSNKTKYSICSETKNGEWGKLKNGKGWISLDCVKRIY